ncbi:hypothetical protein AB0F52_25955 [Amycolatopsis sp. NPDC024027]|uniref:hypothetical protein n=1 Tax=Amycolatopsis sp. NPDC024027 TaxID=3154327 RepID=UPI0033E7AE55
MRSLLLIGAALAGTFLPIVAAPASAATVLGGVDMQAACNNQYPGQGRLAKIRTMNVYGWKCVSGAVPVADGDIDVWKQCRTQYNRANAYGGFRSYSDPYSWYCSY